MGSNPTGGFVISSWLVASNIAPFTCLVSSLLVAPCSPQLLFRPPSLSLLCLPCSFCITLFSGRRLRVPSLIPLSLSLSFPASLSFLRPPAPASPSSSLNLSPLAPLFALAPPSRQPFVRSRCFPFLLLFCCSSLFPLLLLPPPLVTHGARPPRCWFETQGRQLDRKAEANGLVWPQGNHGLPETLPGRLELPTLRLTASRSNQLSYGSFWKPGNREC